MSTSTEKRFRTPRACDSCKRKKKQCSGTQPCSLCNARSQTCIFSNTPASAFTAANRSHAPPQSPTPSAVSSAEGPPRKKRQKSPIAQVPPVPTSETREIWPRVIANETANATVEEDEAPIHKEGRMLQDGEGRLLYVGDSASLSYLQTIRRLVEGTLGSSAFTMDVNRHRLLEASFSTPARYQHTSALPDLEAAMFLVDSFFRGTSGLFQIFDKESFIERVKQTYDNPLAAQAQWLCILNLVFAVGMQLRKDSPGTQSKQCKIINRLDILGANRSELFFLASKHLNDPIFGFEDGGFASIQALLLMTIYMLAAAKRNAAWGYLGMATRTAYALGLHREETMSVFSIPEQVLRRKLWRSLYVMDCFLSASLGRPNAINLSELPSPEDDPCLMGGQKSLPKEVNPFLAAFTASKITGEVLTRVYQKRKASRSVALEISMHFNDWMKDLPPTLHWEQLSIPDSDEEMTLARVHLNLIYFHGIILLTRPFLLHQINQFLKRSADLSYEMAMRANNNNDFTQTNCFHGACVRSAVHSVTVVQAAYTGHILSRRDPFIIYWLFSAALVILSNAFCPVHHQPSESNTMTTLLSIMRFMGEADPQARRYLHIIESFYTSIKAARKSKESASSVEPEGQNIFNVLFGTDVPSLGPSQTQAQTQVPIMQWPPEGNWVEGAAASMNWNPAPGMLDEAIDFDSFWWPPLPQQQQQGSNGSVSTGVAGPSNGGTGDGSTFNDIHVPLYELMETM
ncbi:fungal specific transcription factor domain-containing protein [Phlyctema vagabunda]|uniref:Fungal specific transcription factor domain-containing protein n=1 Tax=Phlyctema vagabunda TaxID=108571 RepID=A0ABR4P5L1_9HELO